jgi:hypothetical protein
MVLSPYALLMPESCNMIFLERVRTNASFPHAMLTEKKKPQARAPAAG